MTPNAPSLLCPIDFSEFSRQALAYAATIAGHFGARLIVLSVDDPFLTEAAGAAGFTPSTAEETRRELERFCGETLSAYAGPVTVEYTVRVGKPATEILREAQDRHVDLIVMSSHGRSGKGKLFFGSTTERVLRETSVPVLVTREWRRPFASLSDLARDIRGVMAPVDFTPESSHQLSIANSLAMGLSARLIAVHVLEPLFIPQRVRAALSGAEHARRSQAEERLAALVAGVGPQQRSESIVLLGDPSEEIVKLAKARNVGLIVMGLHSSGAFGPRMGSVTYRVLCQTDALVLALPPHVVRAASLTLSKSSELATPSRSDRPGPHTRPLTLSR
jgi:nucleotide-binding universal stress UspA family protein